MNKPDFLYGPAAEPDWSQWPLPSPEVTRIVLGKLQTGNDKGKAAFALDCLPEDFRERFPNLKMLHLWALEGLQRLPALPESLEELDVRQCKDLEALPDLPKGLKLLDIGDCKNLTALPITQVLKQLEGLFIDGCDALQNEYVEIFLRNCKESPLYELDASGCAGMTKLQNIPKTHLRKLVLKACPGLVDMAGLESFTQLEHLNISDCKALSELPGLPAKIRYVLLHGCQSLRRFSNQDIGAYDLGNYGENIAGHLLSRLKFGKELGISAHAKLLLLGDGRVGKTSLSKRLIWEGMPPEVREKSPDAKPRATEQPTHKMRFWAWKTPLKFNHKQIQERARKANLQFTQGDALTGTIRLWDFGGQEIYHNTHRIFASEGSVFLLVWRSDDPDWDTISKEKPEHVTDSEWREWNRRRSLDYWLDYIESMSSAHKPAKVALVRTAVTVNSPHASWHDKAQRHKYQNIPCFEVDSLDDNCSNQPGYRSLCDWISTACGEEAEQIGLIQPSFYALTANKVDTLLEENENARNRNSRAPNLLMSYEQWQGIIKKHHELERQNLLKQDQQLHLTTLDNEDIHWITTYLHRAGQIFRIERSEKSAVLIDQEWGTSLIYEMLRPGGNLHMVIRGDGCAVRGVVFKPVLEDDAVWKSLEDDLQRDQLLAWLQQCKLLVLLADKDKTKTGEELFLANERWLLPSVITDADLQQELDRKISLLTEQRNTVVKERFNFENNKLSEFEFRSVMAWLGEYFSTSATYFREGILAIHNDLQPEWCFRVSWKSDAPDAYLGTLDATLWCKNTHLLDRYGKQIEELFATDRTLARHFGKASRTPVNCEEDDPWHNLVENTISDIGVSSSGKDHAFGKSLCDALTAARFRVQWYRYNDCRQGDYAKVEVFMKEALRQTAAIVLVLSDNYLRRDPIENWYCPWELADAILQWKKGNRSIERTLVIYIGNNINSSNLDDVLVSLFTELRDSFANVYAGKPHNEKRQFRYYNDISCHFDDALQYIHEFYRERGTLGCYTIIPVLPNGQRDFTPLVDNLRSLNLCRNPSVRKPGPLRP